MPARVKLRDPSGAWIAVPGRRKGVYLRWLPIEGRRPGTPSHVRGRNPATGRFARIIQAPAAHYALVQGRVTYWADGYRVDGRRATERDALKLARSLVRKKLAARPHWRFYLEPPRITYHKEDLKGGMTFFRVRGVRTPAEVVQWVIASMLDDRIPLPKVVRFKDDLDPADPAEAEVRYVEDGHDTVQLEVNDADMNLENIQRAYELAGADSDGNDIDDEIEPEIDFSEETEARLLLMRQWELELRRSQFGRWALRDATIGVAISYYAVAHKLTYEDRAKFGEVVRTPYAPIGREAWTVLRERMAKAAQKTEKPIEWKVGGFFLLIKVLV